MGQNLATVDFIDENDPLVCIKSCLKSKHKLLCPTAFQGLKGRRLYFYKTKIVNKPYSFLALGVASTIIVAFFMNHDMENTAQLSSSSHALTIGNMNEQINVFSQLLTLMDPLDLDGLLWVSGSRYSIMIQSVLTPFGGFPM